MKLHESSWGGGRGWLQEDEERRKRQPESEVNKYKQGDTGDKSEDYVEDGMNLI